MNRRALAAIAALALAMFALAACGDDDSSSSTTAAETTSASTEASTEASGGGGDTVTVEADPNGDLAFTQTELTAAAGSDTLELDNQSTTPHNVEVEDADGNVIGETDTISGDTASTSVDLEPGTYTFFCDVPGHREAGMEGTLTVK